jgi:2-C-methyl-D-erythritol 4-phosphate cytidylyltransferase/2-C-methyl-D-erythritol 2,4-cyclodiphosphate synthase
MTHRCGIGFDAHRFDPESASPLKLALLAWPGVPPLAGHSDGDVAAHALVDAVASACGWGDIGALFGTDDPRYRGADSTVFLEAVRLRLDQAGAHLVNAAVQVIGNQPVLAPRRPEAQAALSRALGGPVTVSATTTDTMGFTGQGQGLAAIATCLVDLPQ